MRRSVVTWRLTFQAFPSPSAMEKALRDAARLLDPIARTEMPIDHESLRRSDGLSPWLLLEPERELTPAEILLDCLAKAHRLGRGWVLRWPRTPMVEAGSIDHRRGRQPELLEGLRGWWAPDSTCPIPDLVEVTFSVEVLPPPPPPPPTREPAVVPAPTVRPEDVPRDGDEATLSRALVIYSGRGLNGWPRYDERRLERRIGLSAAQALLPEIRRLMEAFTQIALSAGGGLWESAATAAQRFRETHPELSEEAIRTLEWCYAYDMK